MEYGQRVSGVGCGGGGGGGEEREVEGGGYRVTGRGDAGDCSFKTRGK